jgi:glycine oxidase
MTGRSPDAIIIGAGIIGSTIAWRLRQQGMFVMLLDAGRMGGEASSAGAGMLAPGGEVETNGPIARLAKESLAIYPEFIAELQDASGVRIDFQRHGALELAADETAWERLRMRAAKQEAAGVFSRPVGRHEIHELAPMVAPSFANAFYYPADATVDPRHIMAALRAVCASNDCAVRENMPVSRIDPVGSVTAGDETFTCGNIVLAAGAWSTSISGLPRVPRAYPVRGHLICFELFAGSLRPIVRENHTYILQRADGRTICGTSTEDAGFNRSIDPYQVSDITIRARKLLPSLDVLPVTGQWNGFRPACDNPEPVVGRFEETALWLAYGHYRNGILLAPETARRLTCAIAASR